MQFSKIFIPTSTFQIKLLSFLVLIFIQTTPLISSAGAETGYRYWGYFQAAPTKTDWNAAMTGPTTKLADGAVEGWAFSFSTNDIPAAQPTAAADFNTICQGVVKPANQIRVALVIDFGKAEIAPKNETAPTNLTKCVLVKPNATGLDVLNKVVKVRTDNSGLICAFNGYPKSECSPEVDLNLTTAIDTKAQSRDEIKTKQEIVSVMAAVSGIAIAIALALAIRRQKRSK